ncbi:MarR family transcriptional regulator [Morganella morganii]|uniref:MarR family transcriptional regulator n=1 Tax=Morganella morganii TaxID=582 RepID=UPI00139730D1|nr:MarR family transcriptional regulator [Morganella morganii]ELA7736003.1 MarR family transcriptional regulator [Morganella morganii]MBC3967981.1 MarR family transcriptional regulator [Morganella morganii]MBC3999725.1 MarR family transcriptional regulator [Morganella morganii]QHW20215.1 MarR family transcriptional regulator [Morganella morganii]HCQ8179676.1 MarR family transcriptional regulator [Morganella morganii]
MKGKGTDFKALMWVYATERMSQRKRYIKSGGGRVNYNRKLHKPYRCERVLDKLLRIDARGFIISIKQGATNGMD